MARSYPSGAASRCLAGALTDTAFSVSADVSQSAAAARIVVSLNSDLSSPVYTSPYAGFAVTSGDRLSYSTVAFTVTGLSPSTTYYYRLEMQGAPSQLDTIRSIKTAPPAGAPAAFKFTVGSCSDINNSTISSIERSLIHQAMALENALFFIHIDDIIYSDIATISPGAQRDSNVRLYCSSPDVQALIKNCPLMYMPGDHDMGVNDSTLDSPNGEVIFRNSRLVYRETMPHYAFAQQTLGETNIDHVTLTQSADIAKVRFILLDCMSQSRLGVTALGQGIGNGDYWDQRSWLATALTQAQTDGIAWLFLVLPRGWNGYNQVCFNDSFTAERIAICNLIEECTVPICLLVGDTHCCAFDDGTHAASFAADGFAFFPQIQASGMFNTPVADAGVFTWNSVNTFRGLPVGLATPADGGFVSMSMAADNLSWTAIIKGAPITEGTNVPTSYNSISSADVTPAVSFNNAAPTVVHGTPLTVNLDKTWFGACTVHWASSDGQSGNVTFKPNKKRATFIYNAGSAGSVTLTLSSPSGCTIAGTNPATVTVT